ncbi:MAG: tRNA (adenosine(37)-N6)-threonylcarbamoyltransferase complex transferase subunit TsaD [bacterium]|nr:tRNA (adenosine(37)-N6)-threonylcarbamoyltransferase complex transferase subunit TsaD [bacterium]
MPHRILGIETSCDETSVAILDVGSRVKILHHDIASQIDVHALYGGVVPEVAARLHVAETVSLIDRALSSKAGQTIDAVAVTQGPGLATALRVGIEAGRAIAFAKELSIIGVNHLEGHLASAWLVPENRRRWVFPILTLLVSGGHSELVLMKDFCSYRVLGRSRDDAAGEAFDKTAKLIGLGYPGGPAISKHAQSGNPIAFDFPRPMMHDRSFDFSFSGLKTAVRREWESMSSAKQKKKKTVDDFSASVQQAIIDVLVHKTIRAIQEYQPKAVTIVGGVSANSELYAQMKQAIGNENGRTFLMAPARGLHTDNAAMIAAAGAWRLQKGERHDWRKIDAKPEWDL